MTGEGPEIVRNEDARQFELANRAESARLRYRQADGVLKLVHTEVDDALEGQGVGSALVREALAYAEREALRIVPLCPFVAGWLERHPERAAELDIAHP